jgi:transcriptional regulator with XRE-family HTH domain
MKNLYFKDYFQRSIPHTHTRSNSLSQQKETNMRDTEKTNIYTDFEKRLRPFHIELLATELFRRKKRNPRYSLRAFAHALGIDPGALSRILAGKKQISLAITRKIIRVLQLTPEEKEVFLISVAQEKKDKAAAILSHEFLNPKDGQSQSVSTWPLKAIPAMEENQTWELKVELNNQAHIDQTIETIRKYLAEASTPSTSCSESKLSECKLILHLRPLSVQAVTHSAQPIVAAEEMCNHSA